MPAHIKSALTNNQISLSVKDSELLLGTWQGIYLFEHRLDAQKRTIIHHFIGCLLYTSPSPRDRQKSRMPSSA